MHCLALSPNSEFAAFSYGAGDIGVVKLDNGKPVAWLNTAHGRQDWKYYEKRGSAAMAWNSSSTKLLFVFRAKFSALWDLTKLNDDAEPSLQVLAEHGSDVVSVATSPDGRTAVTGSEDRKSTRLNSSHSGESRMPSSA